MTNLLHHYKDRNPEETIQIVTNFFTKRNCRIVCSHETHSNADTYSCTYHVYWHGRKIHQANGKGVTSLYAKASCFAELYERFCLYAHTANMDRFILLDLMNKNLQINNYHCASDEKELSYVDVLDEPHAITILTKILPTTNKKFINDYLDIFFGNKFYGQAFHNLINNSIEYKNIPTIASYYGSTGFAAGNTLEEAIVQGSSEIFERYTIQQFYAGLQDNYCYIEEEYLPEYIQHFFQEIRKDNPDYDIRLYDLSYNFHLPVCLLLINDSINHLFYFNFAAAPVFEIAAERCFTEIYQGSKRLPMSSKIIKRPNDMLLHKACLDAYESTHKHEDIIIPENLILKSEPVKSYNTDIFLSGEEEYSNLELLDKIKEFDRMHKFNFYWADISLMKDMKAVYVITRNCKMQAHAFLYSYISDLPELQKMTIFNLAKDIMDKIDYTIHHNDITESQLEVFIKDLIQALTNFDSNDLYHGFDFICQTLNTDVYNIYTLSKSNTIDNYTLFYNLMLQNFGNIALTEHTSLKHLYQNYFLYILYQQDGYSQEVIDCFFNFLGYRKLDIDPKDLNVLYLIKKVFVDSLYELYHSQEYDEFLSLFIKDKDD